MDGKQEKAQSLDWAWIGSLEENWTPIWHLSGVCTGRCTTRLYGVGNQIRTDMMQFCRLPPKPFSHPDMVHPERIELSSMA